MSYMNYSITQKNTILYNFYKIISLESHTNPVVMTQVLLRFYSEVQKR